MLQQRSAIMERSLILLLTIGIVLLHMTIPDGAIAQVLDRRVEQLLGNNCTGLLGGPANDVDSLTGNLKALCQFPNTGAASSAGGGAASVQGSAASILNRAVVQRLDQLTKEGSQEPKPPTSLLFNPIGLLTSGFGQYPSVSSPFYAATTGGGSTATFTGGSQTRWNGVGFFASGLVEALNRDVTTFQDGYKSTIFGITTGSDYRFSHNLVAGFAFNYANTDGDFRSGGNFSTNSYGGLLFASYLPTEKTFVQLTGGYTRNNYLVARLARASVAAIGGQRNPPGAIENISGLASSHSTGNVFNLGFLTGYHHTVGRFTIGPRAGLYYSNTRISSFSETGNTGIELTYDAQTINSLQSILGIQGSAAFRSALGVLIPQFNADYIHEFANSQRLIGVQFAEDHRLTPTKFTFQNDVPVRNYFNLGTGLLMVLPNGWQTFVQFRAMVGNEQFNNYAGTLGLRIEL